MTVIKTVPVTNKKTITKKVKTKHLETRTRTEQHALPRPVFDLVPVTTIVPATSGLPGWAQADLPFTGAPVALGQPVTDGQTPFHFAFDWPSNNYQLSAARVVIDTSRDTSDTEAIYVDQVFTGRPPLTMVNGTSPNLLYTRYFGQNTNPVNTYFIDFALSHYKRQTRNTFDLDLANLLDQSPVTEAAALEDGRLDVVTGDDSPVFQAFLVMQGLTMTPQGESLTCTDSDTYTFTNVYLHNDGNTVGQTAFQGTAGTPYTAWPADGSYSYLELSFDAPLPRVATANIDVTSAKLAFKAKKLASGGAAFVVNGIGVSTAGFDRNTATAAVESWNDDATAAFEAYLLTVTTNAAGANSEIDLESLFGADEVRALLAQGKLNIAMAGSLIGYGQAATQTRGFGVAVAGPELKLDGTYFTEVCSIPENGASPLTQGGLVEVPLEYETAEVEYQAEVEVEEEVTETVDVEEFVEEEFQEEVTVDPAPAAETPAVEEQQEETTVLNDGAAPQISSVQAIEITSNAATIVWLTDEGATTHVAYGVGGPSQSTATDTTLTTFHRVRLTGLSPYKYYNYQVITQDQYGNESTSAVAVFTTLR